MLTHKGRMRAFRLMDQVGELRPGFLEDGTTEFRGPKPVTVSNTSSNTRRRSKRKKVTIDLSLKKDATRGDIHIVQQ